MMVSIRDPRFRIRIRLKSMPTAYCVKCRKRDVEMKDPREVTFKGRGGKRRAMRGTCPVCGCGMFRILGKA